MDFLKEKFIKIRDFIYQICPGDDGFMSVLSGNPNSKLETIQTNGDKPKNRISFSISKLDNDNIILIGGINESMYCMEIFQYNIPNQEWKQIKTKEKPISVITNHVSATVSSSPKTNEYVIYVVGGNLEFVFFNEILIISIKNGFYTTQFARNIQNAPLKRVGHTLTTYSTHAYLFGGLDEEGNILSSLIDIDFSLFLTNPIIKILTKDSIFGRFMHTSYFIKDQFYISGGYGYAHKKLDDTWKYDGTWSKTSIFKASDRLCSGDRTLYEITDDNIPVIVENKPISDHLNDVLQDLIFQYNITPNIYLEMLNTSDDPNNIVSNAITVVNECVKKIDSIERKPQMPLPKVPHVFLAQEINSKLQRKKWHFETKLRRLNNEIGLYKEQLELLPPATNKEIADIYDFDVFQNEIEKMDQNRVHATLMARSSRLVREQQQAEAMIEKLIAKQESYQKSDAHLREFSFSLEKQLREMKIISHKAEMELDNLKEQMNSVKIAKETAEHYDWCFENQEKMNEIIQKQQEIAKENGEKMGILRNKLAQYSKVSERIENLKSLSDDQFLYEVQQYVSLL